MDSEQLTKLKDWLEDNINNKLICVDERTGYENTLGFIEEELNYVEE